SANSFSSLLRRCAARSRMWVTKAGFPSGYLSNADICSTQPDLAAKRVDEILNLLGVMRQRRHHAPDRAWPGHIAGAPRDDMDMQLRHQITECRDIELVALGDLFEGARNARDFRHQLRLRDLVEVDDFHSTLPPRHQEQPGVMRVLDDQHLAQRQVADIDRVFFELGVQRPGGGVRGHKCSLFLSSLAESSAANNSPSCPGRRAFSRQVTRAFTFFLSATEKARRGSPGQARP